MEKTSAPSLVGFVSDEILIAFFKEKQEEANISIECISEVVAGTFVAGSTSSSSAANHENDI